METPGASPAAPAATAGAKKEYQTPKGARRFDEWTSPSGKTLKFEVSSEWIVLRKNDVPSAEIFHTYYRATDSKSVRPVTFVFNGGPGAASAFLHIGAVGPKRVAFEVNGGLLPPPAKLETNLESWIEFTDLVFIDPVGTGFSQVLETDADGDPKAKKDPKKSVEEKEFYKLNKDLASLAEFSQRFLSKHRLWSSPIYLAGESYGGFRTAKLAKLMQSEYGIGLSAIIAISPALEWSLLSPTDYDVLHYVDTFCTMALAALFHGKSRALAKGTAIEKALNEIESFATRDLTQALVLGQMQDADDRRATYKKAADFLGLSEELVQRADGRMPFWRFARELFKTDRRVMGFYDATLTGIDPFPDRDLLDSPDPTLTGVDHIFTSAINQLLRSYIGVETDRVYKLLSMEVNLAWSRDDQKHAFDVNVGATDDLRFAMSMNPHMKVLITHGYYDMVTPYFSSRRLVEQMKLLPEQRKNLFMKNFNGGHMFYTWEESRQGFRDWVRSAYKFA